MFHSANRSYQGGEEAGQGLHVDESGHDDGVPVVEERAPEHEAAVVPDGDGVDEPSLHLHCTHQSEQRQFDSFSSRIYATMDGTWGQRVGAMAEGKGEGTDLRRGRRGRARRRGRWRSRSGRAGGGCTLRRPGSAQGNTLGETRESNRGFDDEEEGGGGEAWCWASSIGADLGEGRGVEERGGERRRHGQQRQDLPRRRRHVASLLNPP